MILNDTSPWLPGLLEVVAATTGAAAAPVFIAHAFHRLPRIAHGLLIAALLWSAITCGYTGERILHSGEINLINQVVAMLSGVVAVSIWRQLFGFQTARAEPRKLARRFFLQTIFGPALLATVLAVTAFVGEQQLRRAVDRRDVSAVYLLSAIGFRWSDRSDWLYQEMQPAIAHEDLGRISALLAVNPGIETPCDLLDDATGAAAGLLVDYCGDSRNISDDLLAHAVEQGDLGKTRRLLCRGLDPNRTTDFNAQSCTLLEIARQKHDLPMVELLKLSGEKQ